MRSDTSRSLAGLKADGAAEAAREEVKAASETAEMVGEVGAAKEERLSPREDASKIVEATRRYV